MFVAKLRLSVGTPDIQGDSVFVNSTKVSIVPDNEADEIYYTLDGSDPDKDAEETLYYVSPITISRTTVVRAIAYRYDGVSDIAEKMLFHSSLLQGHIPAYCTEASPAPCPTVRIHPVRFPLNSRAARRPDSRPYKASS